MNKNRRKEIDSVLEDIGSLACDIARLIHECVENGGDEKVIATLESIQEHLVSADSYLDDAKG